MHASTPAGNPAANTPNDRHGDVDRNGDLIDRVRIAATPDLDDALLRLAASISGVTPELERDQLRGVTNMLGRRVGRPA